MMQISRPEDRCRSTHGGLAADWLDTEPVCFRSEAFPEDLPHDEDVALQRVSAAARAPWPGLAAVPLLGLALAALSTAFGR